MPLDAACLTALVGELRPQLEGAKVDKIFQPGRDELVLSLRNREGSCKLLLTANPSQPRLQFTEVSRENPAAPPMFCMLLRKHLTGARILSVTQPPMERLVDLELETLNELGDRVSRHLILEAMGRRSNLILTDENGRITDCLRKVDGELSQLRPVLPGLYYHLPPAREDKRNPQETDRETLAELLAAAPDEAEVSGWLLDQLLDAFAAVLFAIEAAQPTVLFKNGEPKDFSFLPIRQYEGYWETKPYDTFSQLLDDFYAVRETGERVRQKGQALIKHLTNTRNRVARKIQVQQKELRDAQNREQYRINGDLITANLYQMQKGQKSLTAVNYYDPELKELTVALDPLLTPQQNAAKYYKKYTKAKTADKVLTEQLEQGRSELDYLESVLESLQRAEGERDLNEIRQELEDGGYLRAQKQGKKPVKRQKPQPMEFRSTEGLRISVGRNNTQNDQLTCKQAGKSDLWFHTQGIHGAHVILWTEGGTPDEESVTEAAMLAAWFSQGRGGGKIAVDYTPVKYVKKPVGARPGMVVYTTYRTMVVEPGEELVKRLGRK